MFAYRSVPPGAVTLAAVALGGAPRAMAAQPAGAATPCAGKPQNYSNQNFPGPEQTQVTGLNDLGVCV